MTRHEQKIPATGPERRYVTAAAPGRPGAHGGCSRGYLTEALQARLVGRGGKQVGSAVQGRVPGFRVDDLGR